MIKYGTTRIEQNRPEKHQNLSDIYKNPPIMHWNRADAAVLIKYILETSIAPMKYVSLDAWYTVKRRVTNLVGDSNGYSLEKLL